MIEPIGETLPKLLAANAARYGQRAALREKDLGIWRETSWSEYLENVRRLALGLLTLGFKRGDKLAIIGDNRPEWLFAELAAQSLGGAAVGLYQDGVASELAFVLRHSEARIVVVEDQEQVDKLLEVRASVPAVERIIYYDPRGLRGYSDDLLMPFTEVQALGAKRSAEDFAAEVARGRADDVALLCYTSGTTGEPKGAMLTHENLLRMARNLRAVDPMSEHDEFVSFLPMAWIGEQMISLSSALAVGFTVNFPEEPDTAQENIREIGPHVIFAPPRIWENLHSTVQVKIEDSPWLKRRLYDLALAVGYQRAARALARARPGALSRIREAAADVLVLAPLKDTLGLSRIRRAYTGGAALGPDTFRFFRAIGVNLKQIYGQTEVSGISVVHRDGDVKFETVGKPLPETEVRISDSGEIESKSPSVFQGYYNNPQATARSLRDGWLYSGDSGLIDEDGHLVVIDRLADVMKLADGSKFSPQYIENKLKFSMYVKEAVVIGQDRPFVAAVINIDMANTGKWAEGRQIGYTTYTDLAQKPQVYELVSQHVHRVNRELPRAARISRFVLLHKELDADDEELTRTRKVRRHFVEERYSELIAALYGELDVISVETEVRYRTGKTGTMRVPLRVLTMEGEHVA
ncbi:MAG: AMP-binding protein [Chloroflexota bacterium]|nr:AMP-binding protein [Chloroflexota bacterium]